jgi:uncharacterized membrane protein YGL010W
MTTKERLFADYEGYHRDAGNKVFHYIGIPMIVGTLIGLLLRWDFLTVGRFGISAGYVLLAGASLFYLAIAPRLALPMLAAAAFLGTVGRTLPLRIAVALFVLGWVLQFVGHIRYEKKSPAFMKNAGHLLIGPLWVLEKAMGR